MRRVSGHLGCMRCGGATAAGVNGHLSFAGADDAFRKRQAELSRKRAKADGLRLLLDQVRLLELALRTFAKLCSRFERLLLLLAFDGAALPSIFCFPALRSICLTASRVLQTRIVILPTLLLRALLALVGLCPSSCVPVGRRRRRQGERSYLGLFCTIVVVVVREEGSWSNEREAATYVIQELHLSGVLRAALWCCAALSPRQLSQSLSGSASRTKVFRT